MLPAKLFHIEGKQFLKLRLIVPVLMCSLLTEKLAFFSDFYFKICEVGTLGSMKSETCAPILASGEVLFNEAATQSRTLICAMKSVHFWEKPDVETKFDMLQETTNGDHFAYPLQGLAYRKGFDGIKCLALGSQAHLYIAMWFYFHSLWLTERAWRDS